VRPRPPSSGRPAPIKVKPRAPSPGRLGTHKRIERTRRLPLPFQVLFAIAVVALGGGVLFVANGGIGRIADAVSTSFAGFVEDLSATPVPSATPLVIADAPLLDPAAATYTNEAVVDIEGRVPAELAGDTTITVRLYVAIGDQAPGIVREVAVSETTRFSVPGVELAKGANTFTATIVGPAGESEPSEPVTYVLDIAKPSIKVTSPKDGAVVNAKSVEIRGTTQGRSELTFTNVSANMTVTGASDGSGAFKIIVPIKAGVNHLKLTVTDPAGNVAVKEISVRKGTGALTATLTAATYTIKRSALPETVKLTVAVTNPDGKPLAGARVTFTLAVPGIPVIASKNLQTNSNGTVSWSTTIPKGADPGQISANAIVKTADFGDTTDRTVLNLVK
jgi:hypothetical protein